MPPSAPRRIEPPLPSREGGGVSAGPRVCISLAAYEPVDWVQGLLSNIFAFSEQQTLVALHLNACTRYTREERTSLQSDRVVLAPGRVPVDKFSGGIMYAHLQNARALHETWPGACAYVVVQHSNMMWFRSGMEAAVRAKECSIPPPREYSDARPRGASAINGQGHPFYREVLGRLDGVGRGVAAYPSEGSFYPLQLVISFLDALETWIRLSPCTVEKDPANGTHMHLMDTAQADGRRRMGNTADRCACDITTRRCTFDSHRGPAGCTAADAGDDEGLASRSWLEQHASVVSWRRATPESAWLPTFAVQSNSSCLATHLPKGREHVAWRILQRPSPPGVRPKSYADARDLSLLQHCVHGGGPECTHHGFPRNSSAPFFAIKRVMRNWSDAVVQGIGVRPRHVSYTQA